MSERILVTGVPRSYTSFIAEMLRRFGVHMGDQLDSGPSGWAKHGLCEDLEFRWLHSCMREPGTYRARYDQTLLDQHEELIRKRDSQHALWGLKSWQLMLHTDLFVRSARQPVKLVYTSRPIEESRTSLAARIGQHDVFLDRRIDECARLLREVVADWRGPILEVSCGSLHDDLEGQARRLADFVGLPFRDEVLSLYDPSWHRFGGV